MSDGFWKYLENVWDDIHSAPKDGTPIIACVRGWAPCVVQWVEYKGHSRWAQDPETFVHEDHFSEYFAEVSYEPTHWMPVPPSS